MSISENRAIQSGPEWLPIETAPKDGTPILVWIKRMAGWSAFAAVVHWEDNYFETVDGLGYREAVTHWMPLPPPPQTGGQIEEPRSGDTDGAEQRTPA